MIPGESAERTRTSWLPLDALTLARSRSKQAGHLIDQHIRDAPIRTFLILLLLVFIWAALHQLLALVFTHVRSLATVAVVAGQQIFIHFFLALAIMLAFSNGVLAFGNLFGRHEPAHLLSLPASPRQIIFVKWLEAMLLSSWSFLLLGVPLMIAVATTARVDWYFYPLFIGHFCGFVVIPSTIGFLTAWAVAMWAPRRPLFIAMWIGGALLFATIIWFVRISALDMSADEWISQVFAQTSFARSPWIPSTWTAQGVVALLERNVDRSLFYLGVVLGNAAMLVWLTVNIVGRSWAEAFNRAQQGRFIPTIRSGWITAGFVHIGFFYLPRTVRHVLLKDIRTFGRDPGQWMQMLIMFALLMLYAMNLQELPLDLENPRVQALLAFLNLTTISLILATFTSRFVYPLLSLESQQLWLLGLLPMRRGTLLMVKFLFALTLTSTAALAVMFIAARQLALPPEWTAFNLIVSFAVCIGLCGISVGLGARLPVLGQRNPARIASGFGGTVNLVVSMAFVALTMIGFAWITWNEFAQSFDIVREVSNRSWWVAGALLLLAIAMAAATLRLGIRHFNKLEA